MFKRILAAVDGSLASNAGLKSAIDLAVDQHATLLVVHVIDDSAINGLGVAGGFSSYADTFYDAMRSSGRKILAKAEATARDAGVDVKSALVETSAATVAHAIVQQAQTLKADVIVLGTHGRRGLRRILMGSDAEEVVREASVPVMLVRGMAPTKRKPRAPAARAALLTEAKRRPAQPRG